MADIELVIKIDEELFNDMKSLPFTTFSEVIIINGTPLPKHHGRLIDADKLLDDIEKQYPASVSETDKRKRYARLVYYWAVKNAKTIIGGSESK